MDIDQSKFSTLFSDPWIFPLVASLLALWVFRRWGDRIRPEESKLLDLLVDVIGLLTAASVVASISTMPLVRSVVRMVRTADWANGSVTLTEGLTLGGGVILMIVTVVAGYWYTREEQWWQLLIFSVLLLAAAPLVPLMYDIMSWWINNPVYWVGKAFYEVITFIPNLSLGR